MNQRTVVYYNGHFGKLTHVTLAGAYILQMPAADDHLLLIRSRPSPSTYYIPNGFLDVSFETAILHCMYIASKD